MALPLLEDDAGIDMLGEEGAAPPPRPAPAAPLVEDDAMVNRSWGRFSHEMCWKNGGTARLACATKFELN